jgi:hypothetical protein
MKVKIFLNIKNNKSKNNTLKNIKIQLNKSSLIIMIMKIPKTIFILHTNNNKMINCTKNFNINKANN